MDVREGSLRQRLEAGLWPLVEGLLGSREVAGLALAVVREEEVVSRGFGVRDVVTGGSVMPETMFHLASVSKPFVATAIVALATARGGRPPVLDLDAPITTWVPEFTLADGRANEVTARGLLSHSSGLPNVAEYGWHEPELGDGALSEFARSLSGWRLQSEPGSTFSYSNAGFELLGLLLARATGTTFENAIRQHLLTPLGMRYSTFLRADVPAHLAASPHVGMPLSVPDGVYPYTRHHAPSSSLHSNLTEMCRWIGAHFEAAEPAAGDAEDQGRCLDAELLDLVWKPVVSVGHPPWDEAAALGWAVGSYRGHRTLSHSGADPGFGSRLVLVPDRRIGVIALANSNTVATSTIAVAALDVALTDVPVPVTAGVPIEPGEGVAELRALLPPVVGPVAKTLTSSGPHAAASTFHRLAGLEPAEFDLDDDGFVDAVWGAIELHRTSLAWPLLRLWTELRPRSSAAWAMTGWANLVDGQVDTARRDLALALELDPENRDASLILTSLPST